MRRERLTITLSSQVLRAVDRLVDRQKLRNRSQTIEFLLREGLGLNRTNQAFCFVEPDCAPELASKRLQELADQGISQLFLCLHPALRSQDGAFSAAVPKGLETTLIPGDFGDAAALLLHRERFVQPFVIAWLGGGTDEAPDLGSLLLFHLRHGDPLTLLLEPGQEPLPWAIASPSLLETIPAGQADLRANVFPNLKKDGKIKAYIR